MSRHEDMVSLRHMRDHAHEAMVLMHGRLQQDLESDRMLELAVVRLLEVVGEAASRVSKKMRDDSDRIPWTQVMGLRNRLIHGYDSVDMDIVWEILHQDIPPLIIELDRLLPPVEHTS